MSDDGNCWDPYCPCRVTRKNIVMTCLAIGCFALVVWSVVVTGQVDNIKSNQTNYVIEIDDSKSIESINITLSSDRKYRFYKAQHEKQIKDASSTASKSTKLIKNKSTALRTISDPANDTQILCQCLCDLNVTREELLEAVQHIINKSASGKPKLTTTTTTPSPTTPLIMPADPYDDWD